MLPDEYVIDELTRRRLEAETGSTLPAGAVEALYWFDAEHPQVAEVARKHAPAGPESVWWRAMLLADLGPHGYAERWREELAKEARLLQEMLDLPQVYVIDGFRIENLGLQPVDDNGEWSIQSCWRVTDDGADEPTMDVFLDEDADVETVLRAMTRWARMVQAEDDEPPG